jgi:hypothetical protein
VFAVESIITILLYFSAYFMHLCIALHMSTMSPCGKQRRYFGSRLPPLLLLSLSLSLSLLLLSLLLLSLALALLPVLLLTDFLNNDLNTQIVHKEKNIMPNGILMLLKADLGAIY